MNHKRSKLGKDIEGIMKLRMIVSIMALFAVVFCWSVKADAATWTITSGADDGSSGTLRYAVNNAAAGDTICFSGAGQNIELQDQIEIPSDKKLYINGPATITQKTVGKRVIILMYQASAEFSNLTFTGGSRADGDWYAKGGGVYNGGTLKMTSCTVRDNNSLNGGGVYNAYGATLNMFQCTVSNNRTYLLEGGGFYNDGYMTLNNCTVTQNYSSLHGSGIYASSRYGQVSLTNRTTVQNNSYDQIYGPYTTDGTCTIGSAPGTNSIIIFGYPDGTDPKPRTTIGEPDVTVLTSDLTNIKSSIMTETTAIMSSDLGRSPENISASLYNAFAYENIPLSDDSGEGSLIIEFTASWPENVRYYAAFSTGEKYTIPARGVQFEIKPGQTLPDGVTPPDFYEPGEGLMTWRNTITDNGSFDLEPQIGAITCRIASIRAESGESPSSRDSGAGCNVGSGFALESLLLLTLPLLLWRSR